ncbi:unnamed protein product, partial [Ixodes persulcatus]
KYAGPPTLHCYPMPALFVLRLGHQQTKLRLIFKAGWALSGLMPFKGRGSTELHFATDHGIIVFSMLMTWTAKGAASLLNSAFSVGTVNLLHGIVDCSLHCTSIFSMFSFFLEREFFNILCVIGYISRTFLGRVLCFPSKRKRNALCSVVTQKSLAIFFTVLQISPITIF